MSAVEEEPSSPEFTGTSKKRKVTRDYEPSNRRRVRPSTEQSAVADQVRRVSRRLRAQLTTAKGVCLICQKKEKPGRDKRGRLDRRKVELPKPCTNIGDTFLDAATLRDDERVLLVLGCGGDAVAAGVMYHRSCYARYINKKDLARLRETETEKSTPYDVAFGKLVASISQPLLAGEQIFEMPALCGKFCKLLAQEGQTNAKYRTEKLKRRLRAHFGSKVAFDTPREVGKCCLVYCADTPLTRLVKLLPQSSDSEYSGDEDDLDDCDGSDISVNDGDAGAVDGDDVFEGPIIAGSRRSATSSGQLPSDDGTLDIFHAAVVVRADLLRVPHHMPWPPSAEDITEDKISVPDSLYNLLALIVIGMDDVPHPGQRLPIANEDDHRRILSMAQDILYNTRKGRVKTPKHVGLAMAVHHITRSSQLLSMLNGFGHTIAPSQLQELDTALAQREINRSGSVIVPSNISPTASAVFCFDNFDLCEETRTGSETTHCTNGIVVQRSPATCRPEQLSRSMPVVRQATHHRRSITAGSAPLDVNFTLGTRSGPPRLPGIDLDKVRQITVPDCVKQASSLDFLWCIARLPATTSSTFGQTGGQLIPSWKSFNGYLQGSGLPHPSTVGYCPPVNASPTQHAAVYEVIDRAVRMAETLDQHDVVITFDQAVYAKAQDILWKRLPPFRKVVARMGAFHTCMTLLAVIGKRFGEAGLRDLLLESEVVSGGSVAGVLAGKHYNRAMRAHKTVAEALFRIQWAAFEESLGALPPDAQPESLSTVKDLLSGLRSNLSEASAKQVLNSKETLALERRFRQFCTANTSPTAIFWQSYLDIVFLLLRFIRATREANWELHLQCIRAMIPWLFAYDRVNYARYLSAYWYEMIALPVTHPDAYNQMVNGDFAVQRSTQPFSQVAVDHAIEQSINRDMKTSGGIIGISQRPCSVQRWILSAHHRADFTGRCRTLAAAAGAGDVGSTTRGSLHVCSKDEDDVAKVLAYLRCLDVSPFGSDGDELVAVCSGVTATADIREDLLKAHNKGTDAMIKFFQERILSDQTGFYQPIPAMKLKSFGNLSQSSHQRRSVGPAEVIRSDKALFSRLTLVAGARNLDMRGVLAHELGSLPWSLANTSGGLQKTPKSKLIQLLEGSQDPAQPAPAHCVDVFDGMAVVQALKPVGSTFSDLARQIFNAIILPDASRVDFVCDDYPAISIKSWERDRRAASAPPAVVQIRSREQRLPRDWKRFLSASANKINLIQFLSVEWQEPGYASTMVNKFVFLTNGNKCIRMTSGDGASVTCEEVEALTCCQEEADTRLFLHAHHAATHGADDVAIRSPDTDVLVIGCSLATRIPARLLWKTGTGSRRRCVDLTAIAKSLGQDVCDALPGMHAFTGCDSISAFYSQGKRTAFDLVKDGTLDAMQRLGCGEDVSTDLARLCEEFTCRIYSKSIVATNVNELRYRLFTANPGKDSALLPPTQDALLQHTRRANYQARIWRLSLDNTFVPPSPAGHGWELRNGQLHFVWATKPAAPAALIDLTRCNCSTGCDSRRCSCHKSSLPCTEACGCNGCNNRPASANASHEEEPCEEEVGEDSENED